VKRQSVITILTFCTVLLFVISFSYWNQYRRDEVLQTATLSQIAELRKALAEVPAVEGDPKKDLAAANERVEKAKSALPAAASNIAIVKRIIDLGAASNLTVVPLATEPPGIELVGKHSYGVQQVSITAKGYFSGVLTYIKALEGIEPAAVITDIEITRGTPAEVAAFTNTGEIPVTARIEITVYSRVQPTPVVKGAVK
jgi:hypothetical protein